jgi:WD40 repeat protein
VSRVHLDGQPWRWCPSDGCPLLVRIYPGQLKVWDEESGELHRQLEGFGDRDITCLATFLSADGQQPRLVAGSSFSQLRVYDPEAGSELHRLRGHTGEITGLACIASSSAAPHHPRLVSTGWDRTAKVWDGETGEMLADLRGHEGRVNFVAVWKEHTGGRDRIATAGYDGHAKVWDGEAFTLLHDLVCGDSGTICDISAFKSAEGPHRLLVALSDDRGLQVWDPEEGRLLPQRIDPGSSLAGLHVHLKGMHLLESAQGRHLLAITGSGTQHPWYPGDTDRSFLDVWDLGEVPPATGHVRPAHKHG